MNPLARPAASFYTFFLSFFLFSPRGRLSQRMTVTLKLMGTILDEVGVGEFLI